MLVDPVRDQRRDGTGAHRGERLDLPRERCVGRRVALVRTLERDALAGALVEREAHRAAPADAQAAFDESRSRILELAQEIPSETRDRQSAAQPLRGIFLDRTMTRIRLMRTGL